MLEALSENDLVTLSVAGTLFTFITDECAMSEMLFLGMSLL